MEGASRSSNHDIDLPERPATSWSTFGRWPGKSPYPALNRRRRVDAASIDVRRVPACWIPATSAHGLSERAVVARKLEALTVLGLLNGRLKDYYDIALLARLYPFDGDPLAEAIARSFDIVAPPSTRRQSD